MLNNQVVKRYHSASYYSGHSHKTVLPSRLVKFLVNSNVLAASESYELSWTLYRNGTLVVQLKPKFAA